MIKNLKDKKTIWTQNAKADYWKNKSNFDGDVGKIYEGIVPFKLKKTKLGTHFGLF